MQFLLHGSITPAAGEALVRHGHKLHWPAESGLDPAAALDQVLHLAIEKQWDLITTESALPGLVLQGGSHFKRSLVYLQLSGGDVEQDDAIDRLFTRYPRLAPLRLYTVTENRVKVRQLPGR